MMPGVPAMLSVLAGSLVFLLGLTSSLADSHLAIPKPTDPLLPPPPPPTIGPSIVNLTLSVSLQHLAQAVQDSFPIHHQHEDQWTPGKRLIEGAPFEYRYYLWRGPAQFKLTGNQLVTEFPDVRYRVAARVSETDGQTRMGTCGYGDQWPRHLRLTATSLLSWAESWRLHTITTFEPPALVDDCRLTPLMADVGPLLAAGLKERLPPLATAIDRTVAERAEAKQRAEGIWQRLQEPVELKRGMWLAFRPSGAQAGPITPDGEASVQSVVSLAFHPTVTLGPKPPVPVLPLPPLQLDKVAAPEGLHLSIPVQVSYEELNRRLMPQVVGEEIQPPVGSATKVTDLQVYGSGDRLIAAVSVSGGVNGTLYLAGRPSLDTATQVLEFREFGYTMETKNVLAKTINRMMYDAILEQVLPDTRIDLRDLFEDLRNRIERQLTRELVPGTWLEGSVTQLTPRGIYPTENGLEIQVVVDGNLKLTIVK
ncbi:MAG: DUF4403 family protein [Nitrospiraceae bacterium]